MIKAGTEIRCPGCDKLLAITNKDIPLYSKVNIKDFYFMFSVKNGDRMNCPDCGADYSIVFSKMKDGGNKNE